MDKFRLLKVIVIEIAIFSIISISSKLLGFQNFVLKTFLLTNIGIIGFMVFKKIGEKLWK